VALRKINKGGTTVELSETQYVVRNGIRALLPTPEKRKAKARQYAKATLIPQAVHDAVRARSGGRCEIRGPHCTGEATEHAHIVGKGMGGRKGLDKQASDSKENIRHSCATCHAEVDHGLVIAN
jgi:hypothetical protein